MPSDDLQLFGGNWTENKLKILAAYLRDDPNKALRGHLDRIFGTEDWFESFYRTRREEDIFGQSYDIIEKACSFDGIGKFYLERLRSIFAAVAENPRVLRNSRGPLFQFFFAAGNEKGAPIAVKIANHLLERL